MLKSLTRFEWALWAGSVLIIIATALIFKSRDILSISASLIGVSALIFVAKGMAMGQVLTIVFAVFYGIISVIFKYYGEMITYLCMTAPCAVVALISWIKHPYRGSNEVEVSRLNRKKVTQIIIISGVVTVIFYFILKALGNASLILSTFSITTSMLASLLTAYRSKYYALAYAANDIVLIGLWISAALKDISCVPMVACFVMFFANDIYGYYNWCRMLKKQGG